MHNSLVSNRASKIKPIQYLFTKPLVLQFEGMIVIGTKPSNVMSDSLETAKAVGDRQILTSPKISMAMLPTTEVFEGCE